MRQTVKFTLQRSHTTKKEKQTRRQGLTVTSARLPSGCSCYSTAATCCHQRWDWAFPHGPHKQRTHCPVRVFSHPPPPQCSALWSPSLLRDAANEHADLQRVGTVLVRLLSKPISAMYFVTNLLHGQLALLHFVLCPEVLDLDMPRLPKALAMRYANGR